MSAIVRCWIAFAAVGAGLIHLALAANALPVASAVLAITGVAVFGWGVLVMFDERFVAPRVSVIAILVPIGIWMTLLVIGAPLPFFPLLVATALELFIAAVLAVRVRRGRTELAPASTGRFVVALIVGGLVVAGVTVPALTAASLAPPADTLIDGVHH